MNGLKSRPARALADRTERAIAHIAMRAAMDAWNGGARALVLLKRLQRSPHYREYCAAVDASYHSNNPPHDEYTPYECPECGCVHLGATKALNCCYWNNCEDDDNGQF